MSSICFFTPIVYQTKTKSLSERCLEKADEYFYLGNQPRFAIFDPNVENVPSESLPQNFRSWSNIAWKVVSYFTLILPLLALTTKAVLRSSLQIPAIQVLSEKPPETRTSSSTQQDLAVEPSPLVPFPESESEKFPLKQLPTDTLSVVGTFLTHEELGQFAQASHFTRQVQQDTYQIEMNPLKREIEVLPLGPLVDKDFERLLVALLNSSAVGHPTYWTPVMDALLSHLPPFQTIDELIQRHAKIAQILAKASPPISPYRLSQFCKYLEKKALFPKPLYQMKPWIGYRILEQYKRVDETTLTEFQKAYLKRKAERIIHVREGSCSFFSNSTLKYIINYQQIDIDPTEWFGLDGQAHSLWEPAQSLPEPILEALWDRIQALSSACVDRPFQVSMGRRANANFPLNFTLPLAKRITQEGLFLNHYGTIEAEGIGSSVYTQSLVGSWEEDPPQLIRTHYPSAIKLRYARLF